MSLEEFTHEEKNVRDILPPHLLSCKYDLFNEINDSANKAKEKYGNYLWPLSDLEHLELYFNLIKNACDNKKMIIKNLLNNEVIESDIYFITNLYHDGDYNFVFNYYYEKENIVLGLVSGSGVTGLSINVAYMIYFNEKKIFHFDLIVVNTYTHAYYLPKIKEIIETIDIDKINSENSRITTLEGYNTGLHHACCIFLNGIYIMETIGIKNNIDELIIGGHDAFLIEEYYKNKYPEINIVKGLSPNELVGKVCKGVIFKYGHYHVTNNCAEFIKSYIQKVMPLREEYKHEIEFVKNNFYPVFSVNLRCVSCEIKNQADTISETINKLKTLYPRAFFYIGGYIGDYNDDLLNKIGQIIGGGSGSYGDTLNAYQKTFEDIKSKLTHEDFKSILNLKINNILAFIENVHFSINMNAGYTCLETVLNNIPSIYFGTKWNYHNRNLFYVSKQNYKEPVFIEEPDIKFLTENIYDPITCEISSDTLVNLVFEHESFFS